MEAELKDLYGELTNNSLDEMSGVPREKKEEEEWEEDLVESLLFDSDNEDDEVVIDDLSTLIILADLVKSGEKDQKQVKNANNWSPHENGPPTSSHFKT